MAGGRAAGSTAPHLSATAPASAQLRQPLSWGVSVQRQTVQERSRKQLDCLAFSHDLTSFRDLIKFSQHTLEPVARPGAWAKGKQQQCWEGYWSPTLLAVDTHKQGPPAFHHLTSPHPTQECPWFIPDSNDQDAFRVAWPGLPFVTQEQYWLLQDSSQFWGMGKCLYH